MWNDADLVWRSRRWMGISCGIWFFSTVIGCACGDHCSLFFPGTSATLSSSLLTIHCHMHIPSSFCLSFFFSTSFLLIHHHIVLFYLHITIQITFLCKMTHLCLFIWLLTVTNAHQWAYQDDFYSTHIPSQCIWYQRAAPVYLCFPSVSYSL